MHKVSARELDLVALDHEDVGILSEGGWWSAGVNLKFGLVSEGTLREW